MIATIRNSYFTKIVSLFLLVQMILPMQAWAITGGPSQPEFTTFTPVGVNDMVDLFSGDFQYNIPLLDVDGYPVNLSYSSAIGMEDQASCVGLGWTLNAGGVVNRSVRGIPDDFKGEDKITTTTNYAVNWTAGANFSIGGLEIIGNKIPISLGMGVFYNNYTGAGFETNVQASVSVAGKVGAAIDLGVSSESGYTVGLSGNISDGKNAAFTGLGGSLGYNSRAGLRSASITSSALKTIGKYTNTSPEIGTFTIPVALETYVPQMTQPMKSFSVVGNLGLGGEVFWTTLTGTVRGYYSDEKLADPVQISPAYGYLYSGEGAENQRAMLDFNREKDGVYKKCIPALPMTQMTYDIYTATGQGVSGMFRPHRDVGTVFDPFTYSSSSANSLGGDVGVGGYVKFGLNFQNSYTESTSGKWSSDNNSINGLKFKKGNADKPNYEQVYFRSAGEFSTINETYFNNLQGFNPVRIQLNSSGKMDRNFRVRNNLAAASESSVGIGDESTYMQANRAKRNQLFSYLTASEVQRNDSIFEYNENGTIEKVEISPTEDERKGHHISEITVTRPDGTRYIYGSQTYNYVQEEVTFNVAGRVKTTDSALVQQELVQYNVNDASVNNKNGIDNYYNSNELPPYANAYQLTSIVSPDYVDVTNNGLTPDDLGNYTKFNYIRLNDKGNPYHWRNPYSIEPLVANLQKAFRFKEIDDKATFLYGEKEIKLLHSIETKNNIALFYYSDRDDAYDVKGRHGERGVNTLQKLDSIKLFSKLDMSKPLKSVHLEYNYSLCQDLPSNKNYNTDPTDPTEDGKLTLTGVWFTYDHSQKGRFSVYEFEYPTTPDGNPTYDLRAQDRWGQYKKNNGTVSNIDEPYADQAEADNYANVWRLKTIRLPFGGEINVTYEADDYAYVQDKRAAKMTKILGFGNKGNLPTTALSSKLYNSSSVNNFVYIKTDGNIRSNEDFINKYLGEGSDRIENLFFRCYLDLDGKNNNEYISGYIDIKNIRVGYDNNNQSGWIELPKKEGMNPIAREAMQFVLINSSDLYYGGNNQKDLNNPSEAVFRKLAGLIDDFTGKIKGTYNSMADRKFAMTANLDRSYLRLLTPDYSRKGGGSRVKQVTINDRWKTMSGQDTEDFSYGQTYKYELTTTQEAGGIPKGTTISSGVTPYEPMLGGEENPLRHPKRYTEDHKWGTDYELYQEKPYGESFFPSPSVGYSRVVVTNLNGNGAKRSATGYTENEFYTAKDFPVIVKEPFKGKGESKDPVHNRPAFLSQLLKIDAKEDLTVSQSYAIELNDMHGKPKATKVYAEGQSVPVSSVEYFYKMENSKQLSNRIPAIENSGRVKECLAGIDVELVIDERENVKSTTGKSVDANGDVSPAIFGIPFPIPIPYPGYYSEKLRFRSVTATKIITRHGILEKTVAQDLGSHVTSTNLGWDAETGEVLLTQTQNNFNDAFYTFTYPAHWAYDGMGAAYRNAGMRGNFGAAKNYLAEGDELFVNGKRVWVTEKNNGIIKMQDIEGKEETVKNTDPIVLFRSGRRNMQNTPVGSITSRINPIAGGQLDFDNAGVLNAGAVEFNAHWPENLCETCMNDEPENANPYITGEKGNFRPKRSFVYLTGRSQSDLNGNTNIREDGTFERFSPFWKNPNRGNSSFGWSADSLGWTFATEVTMFSRFGYEIENRDALGRYTSATYGYNNSLPTAASANAQYREVGFSGFEDSGVNTCDREHFGFLQPQVDETAGHTGHTGTSGTRVTSGTPLSIQKALMECEQMKLQPEQLQPSQPESQPGALK
jgi:hypothetical protein